MTEIWGVKQRKEAKKDWNRELLVMKLFSIWLALVAQATAEEAQSLQDVLPYLKVDLGLILIFKR